METPEAPLRIAFFVGEFPILSETFVIRQVAGLVSAGHDVTVLTGRWGDRNCTHEMYRKHGLERHVIPIRDELDGRLSRIGCLGRFAARSLLRSSARRRLAIAARGARGGYFASLFDIAAAADHHLGRYDVIIAHFGPAGLRALRLKQAGLLSGPLVTAFHGYDMSDRHVLRKHGYYRALFPDASRFLPVSQLWRRRLIEWGAPPGKVEVLRMGVDLDRLPVRRTTPLDSPLRVLSVARFTEKKGLRYALEGVMKARTSIRYELLGDGPQEAELRALAGQAGDDKDIVFLGMRSQEEVFARFQETDVFLLPSVTADSGDMEGVPVALMEAMAKGLVVLTTAHSGIPELVVDGESGFLVPERDPDAIARALDAMPGDADRLSAIRAGARAMVETHFDNVKLDEQLARLCASVAAEGARARPGADAG